MITGHSLGAGTAALLSMLLRDQYPQLRCFAFSPPGWLVRYVAFGANLLETDRVWNLVVVRTSS